MKKPPFLLAGILILLLCGCSTGKSSNSYPVYFTRIVQDIEASQEVIRKEMAYIPEWCEQSIGSGTYKNKIFTCYIDGEKYSFDLRKELIDAEDWAWMVAGVFHREEEEKTYICLNDFNFAAFGENVEVRNPQLLLIEFSMNQPEDYQVTSYVVEPYGAFAWIDGNSRRVGNSIYFGANSAQYYLGMINLDTKQFRYCVEEYSTAQKYVQEFVQKKFPGEHYGMSFFMSTYEQDGVIVYSASISKGNDVLPVGLIFTAFKDNAPIAYMGIDLTTNNILDGIEIKMLE